MAGFRRNPHGLEPCGTRQRQRACGNVWPAPSASGLRSAGLITLHKRIRPSGDAVGQDGDPRVLVLIKGSALSAIFPPEASRTPIDCQAIFLSPLADIGRPTKASPTRLGSGSHRRQLIDAFVAQQRPDSPGQFSRQSGSGGQPASAARPSHASGTPSSTFDAGPHPPRRYAPTPEPDRR